jgi:penicillin-binding protein 1C
VSLLELTRAYRILARGGTATELRALRDEEAREPTRVLREETAALVASMLSDDAARESAFGRNSVLELDFPVAVKTGTSKGYRDNFTIGYSSGVTIGVWVGNFDGHPMRGISGVSGAGPLFRKAMFAAMRGRERLPLAADTGLREAEICPLSGERVGPHCPHTIRERFPPNAVPRAVCSMHDEVAVTASGLRAGPGCRKPTTRRRVEVYPTEYRSWAQEAERPLPPETWDPECPGDDATDGASVRILFPRSGATFSLDPSLPREKQRIVVRLRGTAPFTLEQDGRRETVPGYSLSLSLEPGEHRLVARGRDGTEHAVEYVVR